MKNYTHEKTILPFKIICATLGHNYSISRRVTNHINEYKCSHCGREVTDSASGNVELLTNKLKELNSSLSIFFEKKRRHLQAS